MVMYVTLQQARDHLYLDTTDNDNDVTLKIKAASGAVRNYLKSWSPYEPEYDSNGDIEYDSAGDIIYALDSAGDKIVRSEVQQATLILLGIFYKDRDGEMADKWQHGYLPMPVMSLLYPLRDPAMG